MRAIFKSVMSAVASIFVIAGVLAAPASAAPTPGSLYFGGPFGSISDCSTIGNVGIYTDNTHTTVATTLSGTSGFINVQNDCQYYAVYITQGTSTGSIPGTAFNSGANSATTTTISGTGTFTLYRCALVGSAPGTGSAGGCINAGDRTQAATLTSTVSGGSSGGSSGGVSVTPPSSSSSSSSSSSTSATTSSASTPAAGSAEALSALPKSSTAPKLKFDSSSNGLAKASKKSLRKVADVAKDGYAVRVTGAAGLMPGVSKQAAMALAKRRALEIRDYLVKQGVNKDDIIIKTKVYGIGEAPTTKVKVETLD